MYFINLLVFDWFLNLKWSVDFNEMNLNSTRVKVLNLNIINTVDASSLFDVVNGKQKIGLRWPLSINHGVKIENKKSGQWGDRFLDRKMIKSSYLQSMTMDSAESLPIGDIKTSILHCHLALT